MKPVAAIVPYQSDLSEKYRQLKREGHEGLPEANLFHGRVDRQPFRKDDFDFIHFRERDLLIVAEMTRPPIPGVKPHLTAAPDVEVRRGTGLKGYIDGLFGERILRRVRRPELNFMLSRKAGRGAPLVKPREAEEHTVGAGVLLGFNVRADQDIAGSKRNLGFSFRIRWTG